MYVGQQHRHLMQGVQAARRRHPDIKIEVAIISAGYGFVSEDELIAPYERAFNGRSKADIRDLADRLDIPKDTRCFLARRADLILVLLGSKYLQAIAPDETLAFGGPTLLFCGREAAQSLPDKAGVKKVVITRDTAKRFSEGLVWLKGYLARRLLQRIAEQPSIADEVVHPEVDVLDMLDTRSAQVDLEL